MIDPVDGDVNALSTICLKGNVALNTWALLSRVIKASLLPEQTYGEDRPAEDADFECFRSKIADRFKSVWSFISKFGSVAQSQNFDRESLVWTLILCGEHHTNDFWTTEESRKLAAQCAEALCSFYECSSVSQLLLGQSQSLSPCFKQALINLRPKLLKDTWRKHPGAISSYKWLLLQIRTPFLSEYLDIVSPTALIILDDHDDARRQLGLQCLTHIINNVARTELCQRGFHQVFYKTLEPLLWQRTACQIEPVITCVTNLLTLTERGYTRSSEPGMWDLFDDTLSTLLDKMAFEDQIPLRLGYVKSLGPLISGMGHSVTRWSKPLLGVLDEYLHKDSFDTRIYALQALKAYISMSSPRLEHNGSIIMFLLLRTCQDLSNEDLTELDLIRECLNYIQSGAPDNFQVVKKELNCIENLSPMVLKAFEI